MKSKTSRSLRKHERDAVRRFEREVKVKAAQPEDPYEGLSEMAEQAAGMRTSKLRET